MARPGTESSNPSPSSKESVANLTLESASHPLPAGLPRGAVSIQPQRTARIGRTFGPIMALWFAKADGAGEPSFADVQANGKVSPPTPAVHETGSTPFAGELGAGTTVVMEELVWRSRPHLAVHADPAVGSRKCP
jgi:hypothetical protein